MTLIHPVAFQSKVRRLEPKKMDKEQPVLFTIAKINMILISGLVLNRTSMKILASNTDLTMCSMIKNMVDLLFLIKSKEPNQIIRDLEIFLITIANILGKIPANLYSYKTRLAQSKYGLRGPDLLQ